MGASVFANLRRRSALKARASIIISDQGHDGRRGRAAIRRPVSGGGRGAAESAFREALDRDGQMCLCGVLGAEAGALSPDVAKEILSFFHRYIDDLSRRIGGPDAEARAFHVMATLEGGSMLARVYGRIEAFDQAVAGLIQPWRGVDHRETFETQGSAP
jgi:hypothetical protein